MYRKNRFRRKFFDQGYKGPRFAFATGCGPRRKPRIARGFQNRPAIDRIGAPIGGRKVAVQVDPVRITAGPKSHAVGIGAKHERDVFKGAFKVTEYTTQKERRLGFLPVDSCNDKQPTSPCTRNIAKRRSEDRATVFSERKKERGTHLKQSTGR